jgi:hypothetical protein
MDGSPAVYEESSMPDDKKAQEEQARKLREQIEALKNQKTRDPGAIKKPKSRREAVQDRMRELDDESHV